MCEYGALLDVKVAKGAEDCEASVATAGRADDTLAALRLHCNGDYCARRREIESSLNCDFTLKRGLGQKEGNWRTWKAL